ncbi:MAG: LacI family DNA-binding transcriptional regulator [Deferribacteres bacterium]|nr:LacI family DNA-binding transcriptional regulator [Deferribacteres bacterium]
MSPSLTINDIARLANVSKSTVSKVLNDKPDVGLATKKKVMQIVEKHNFVPNASGKSLKKRATENIGVIFRKDDNPLSNPFFSRVLEGIEAEIAFNDLNLMLYSMPSNKKSSLPKIVKERKIDGVILVGTRNEEFVRELQKTNLPLIVVDPRADISDCQQVLIDNENGAFLATQYLINKGHKRIGFIAGELSEHSFGQRYTGYLKALKSEGLPIDETIVKTGGYEAGYELTKSLLQVSERPSAIFAANDINAVLAYKAINEFNLSIPDDISIIGFDDIYLARMAIPPLTTVRVYKEELGSLAVRSMRDMINEGSDKRSIIIMPIKLIKRNSVKDISTHGKLI